MRFITGYVVVFIVSVLVGIFAPFPLYTGLISLGVFIGLYILFSIRELSYMEETLGLIFFVFIPLGIFSLTNLLAALVRFLATNMISGG